MNSEMTTLSPWLAGEMNFAACDPTTDEKWRSIVVGAERTGLAGLILERCRAERVSLPEQMVERLRRAATAVAATNLHLQKELARILTAFHRAGIPVMLLKGAALGPTIYGRPDLRPMGDVDLLVRPEHVTDALALLCADGARRGFELIRADFFPKYHYEVEFFTGGPRPARLDLHARPFRPLRIARTMPDDALWTHALRISINDVPAWMPCHELMFVHLAAHAAFHGCTRLIWLYDLKRVVRTVGEEMDWKMMTDACRQWRLSHAVHDALSKAQDLLGSFLPNEVLETLASHATNWRDRLTLAQAPRDAASPTAHLVVDLLCTSGVKFRLGYIWAFAVPDRTHLAGLYPYRHLGWPLGAHAWRLVRCVFRALSGLAGSFRRVGRYLEVRLRRRPIGSDAVGNRYSPA
ncbi:MAG: nucleotidyltransferase family protein [Planctomycetes bacterium]|nr:nucleotidyltransferase family protein [Planctomycetota bacterium]